ncbi:hypothetical protein V2J09_008440 [Rumex salicifolius]
MEKRSRKTAIGYDKHHSGCMQGLINIFDFRHGRPSQKLLSDKRHGSRRVTGAASTSQELETLDGSCEMCRPAKVSESCETSTRNKLSVKELMEQEMFKQDQVTKMSKSNKDSKQSGHRRRNSWHTNKKQLEMSDVNIINEEPTLRRHKSLSSLEVGEMMAELCTEIDNVKAAGCLSRDQTNDRLNEEKLAEATKVFVSHFVNGKNVKDAKFQPSRELIDALQTLNSNKDAFLKLLQDPSSQLVKHVQKLVDLHAGQEHGKSKNQNNFWRKFKGLDRSLSKKHDHPQNGSSIVILKLAKQNSEHNGSKVQSERNSTNFLFTEFTRKLKNAMRKERGGSAYTEKVVGGESLAMVSPTRDHFFTEKIPRKLISAVSPNSEQQISNIFTGLAMASPTREHSCSNYTSSSPLCSPRKDVISRNPDSNNSESGINSEKIVDDVESKKLDIKDDCSLDEGQEKSLHSNGDNIHGEGYMEIIRPANAELDKRISVNTSSEPCSPSTNTNEVAKETIMESMEKQTVCLDLYFVKENEASSPMKSPIGSSRTSKLKDSDSTLDRSDWTSPISVLEPTFNEGDVSPSIKSIPVAELIQPQKIEFEDQIPCLKTWEEERLSIFESVKDVLQESQLTESQLLERFLFGENLFNQTLFDEVDYVQGCHHYDPKLIYDLIKEVHDEICERGYGGIPSNFKSYISSDLEGKRVVDKIWKGVNRHLQPEIVQSTLEHSVEKDLSVSSTWMDLRCDSESIGIEMEEDIFDDLIEDTILSCIMNQI